MGKRIKKKYKNMENVETQEVVQKPVVCGHEEVRTDENDVKIFKCGEHGEHPLSDCQELCVEK